MTGSLLDLITTPDAAIRNQSLDAWCRDASAEQLLSQCEALDDFRRRSENLYERVRALFFLYAIYRFHLPDKLSAGVDDPASGTRHPASGLIPFGGFEQLLQRRFEEAIDDFLTAQRSEGPSDGIASALASAYQRLAFQTLADQVRRSVRSVKGNQWMFRMGHPADHPLRLRSELLVRAEDGSYPILRERTPVRMDLSHSGWSDIFFLGMDFPEGARVLNVSIDLAVHGRDTEPRPPVEAYLRVIEEPILRLTSVDLGATADVDNLAEVFDFARDYLGLLKAAVIAGGVIPPGIEGSGQSLADVLARIVGPGRGLEIVSNVNHIPKGSRLAVSTNLLAALVSVCMRATGQAKALTGPLAEEERRLVLARALLGEWLGGSGGGWQDSGGVWPGMKLITGVLAGEGDPEFGISRGRLMPTHRIFGPEDASPATRQLLQDCLVLVHGGMAQNVGPILEMVTEKYLLRCEAEWTSRLEMMGILDGIIAALREGDVKRIGELTTRNFFSPIQTIIPWASNAFTETLIKRVRAEFGGDFWGFWMLGGMSGGGMGFIFAPGRKAEAQGRLQEIMSQTKAEMQTALPFAMEPVVYDFAINERGTWADFLVGAEALLPNDYYALHVPRWLRTEPGSLPAQRRAELDKFGAACRTRPELAGMVQTLFDRLLPRLKTDGGKQSTLAELLEAGGFDRVQHEQIRADLKHGRIGLPQNRLPVNADIKDARPEDVVDGRDLYSRTGESSGAGTPPAAVARAPRPALTTVGEAPVVTEPDEASAPLARSGAGATPATVSQAPRLQSPLPFNPFDPNYPASITHRRLPHWTQQGCTYFVTFRLADALPVEFWTQWHRERDEALRELPRNATPERREELIALFTGTLEAKADEGLGACMLAQPEAADEVEAALRHFDGQQYQLGSFVIMPNHVHAIVRPLAGHALGRILQGWKSVSSHKLNRRLGRTGALWQEESFDHIIRDEHQLERFEHYIAQNPEKARLQEESFRLGMGTGGLPPKTAGGAPARPRQAEAPAPLPWPRLRERGLASLRAGELAIVTLAAGAGSRWTQGAGVVKGLYPFAKLGGRHRTFLETHLAKSRRMSRLAGTPLPHLITTSWLTHSAIAESLQRHANHGYPGPLLLSPGRAIGLRMIPMERDLRFLWEEMPQQVLDEQQQKVRDSLHAALRGWARSVGEGTDYSDNLPAQCLHPVGHWYELPNLLRNGVLPRLLAERPQLKHLLLHNIDTLGADADPALFGLHVEGGACLTFEVTQRRLEDRGGGLARVNGQVRLVEGLALPREEDEFNLRYYNSNTCWIDLDQLLTVFGLTRADLADPDRVTAAIRVVAARVPTYITIKDVKKRWGHGQEDVFPVTQWEKLWVDMTALPEVRTQYAVVPRVRGQQLKDQAQLDGWLRDGSAAHVESLCDWDDAGGDELKR